MKKRMAVAIVVIFVISGCATTGPRVSYDEIRKAEDELRLKALKFQSEQLARVTNIGYKILQNLPQEDRRGNYPFVGIYYARVNRDYARLYNLAGEGGVVITVSIKDSPADKAGLAACRKLFSNVCDFEKECVFKIGDTFKISVRNSLNGKSETG